MVLILYCIVAIVLQIQFTYVLLNVRDKLLNKGQSYMIKLWQYFGLLTNIFMVKSYKHLLWQTIYLLSILNVKKFLNFAQIRAENTKPFPPFQSINIPWARLQERYLLTEGWKWSARLSRKAPAHNKPSNILFFFGLGHRGIYGAKLVRCHPLRFR